MLPEKREKIITNARLAMEFTDKMHLLKEQRELTLRGRVGEFTHQLIMESFDGEELKLKKQYRVMQFESKENQGYRDTNREVPKNPIKEVPKTILTAQEASGRYLTYDEWKMGLTKAPDWVYNEGMVSRSAKE